MREARGANFYVRCRDKMREARVAKLLILRHLYIFLAKLDIWLDISVAGKKNWDKTLRW